MELAMLVNTSGQAAGFDAAVTRARSPSPLTSQMDAPEHFKILDTCLKAVQDYTYARMEAKIWDPTSNFEPEDENEYWPNKIIHARAMVRNLLSKTFHFIPTSGLGWKRLMLHAEFKFPKQV
jgi:hypothetical protein